jgi:tetratricopeptide (TPR) repeat protein
MARKVRARVVPKAAPSAPVGVVVSQAQWVRTLGIGLVILCAVFIAYLPAVNGGLMWDDNAHVTRPELQSVHGLWRIWFDVGATQQYYPLLHSAFWLEHQLWGDDVTGYHVVNLVFHALAAWMVFLIVRKLGLPGAWFAAFVFALHPICAEAAAWISEQKSTLSALFYLASMLVYLGFDRRRRPSRYALALVLFVLALLTKTVTATLPAALLVILWWERGRLDPKRDVLPLLPWFALGITAGLFTAWVEQRYVGAQGAHFAITALQRILIASRAIWFYLSKLIAPINLIFNYPHWKVDPAEAWQYLFPLGVIMVAAGLFLIVRKNRGPLAAFLLFTGTLFPALGFFNVFPFIYSYVADHFVYLASLGFLVPSTVGLTVLATRLVPDLRWRCALGVTLVSILGFLTWRQAGMYQDAETLYRETIQRNPSSVLAHNNLGLILVDRPGGLEDAIGEYEAALGADDGMAEIHNNLGIALSRIPGRLPDAIVQYQQAIKLDPSLATAHNDMGLALSQMPGRGSEAIEQYRAALRLEPNFAEVHHNLGLVLSQTPGGLPEAVSEYREALRINPNLMEVHNNLAIALTQMPGKLPDAIAEYEAALRINPDAVNVRNNLGLALAQVPGRLPEAINEFEAGLRVAPDSPDLHLNLGLALLQIPSRRSEAAEQLEAALQLRPDLQSARQILAQLQSGKPAH